MSPDILSITAGLDVQNRPEMLDILHSLHSARAPRIIIGLRIQDSVPEWISHIALVNGGRVITGTKDDILASEHLQAAVEKTPAASNADRATPGDVLIEMKNVGVKYSTRTVRSTVRKFRHDNCN